MLENIIIRPSNSPWASRVILVQKKDGSLRLAIDYRALNDVTKKDSYPIPDMKDILDKLHGSEYFSTWMAQMHIGVFRLQNVIGRKQHLYRRG